MKKALFIIASSLLILTMPGCKKATETNYTYFINEKVSTGTLKYLTNFNPEPFSVRFSIDGSFFWHEIKVDVNGSWKRDGPQPGSWDIGSYYFNQQNGTLRFSNGYDKGFFVIMPGGESIWMTGAFGNGMLNKPL